MRTFVRGRAGARPSKERHNFQLHPNQGVARHTSNHTPLALAGRILIARRSGSGRPEYMGAKYYPTEKDRKLNQRFQQKQNPLPKFKNSTGKSPAKKSKAR
jgi:hypothetical protein